MKKIIVLTLLVAYGLTAALASNKASDSYKLGEKYLKLGDYSNAYLQFSNASSLEPKNSKYKKKVQEVGVLASKWAESKGRDVLDADPPQAEEWFQRAMAYDRNNRTAEENYRFAQERGRTLDEKLNEATIALKSLDFERTTAILNSFGGPKLSIPRVKALQRDIETARRVVALIPPIPPEWKPSYRNLYETALLQLQVIESKTDSLTIKTVVQKTRTDTANSLIEKVLPTSQSLNSPSERLDLVDLALYFDRENQKAISLRREATMVLADQALANLQAIPATKPQHYRSRISLESLRGLQGWVDQNSLAARQIAKLEAESYPGIKLRILIEESPECSAIISREDIKDSIAGSVNPVVRIDDREWDLTLRVKNVNCEQVDIPKQLSQMVNSTFVAGHNQMANPTYIQQSTALGSAQQELNRRYVDYQNNPNSGTLMSLNLQRNLVSSLQANLASTPPYIPQEIIQNYQFEKYTSHRAVLVSATSQLSGKNAGYDFLAEEQITGKSQESDEGVCGVLSQDKTGASNKDPQLQPMPAHSKKAREQFLQNLRNQTKELLAGFFAVGATSSQVSGQDRMAATLYLNELGDGTKYEKDKEILQRTVQTALLSGTEKIKSFVLPISLPLPEQLSRVEEATPDPDNQGFAVERVVDGVVQIETDNQKVGTGFYLTSGCLVVTNLHVVAGAETIILRNSGRKIFVANLLASSPERDLALLRSNSTVCSPLTLMPRTNLRLGQEVFAVGNPLGLSGTVTKGIVSSLRTTTSGIQWIQLDAPINPGNSGGPLINKNGEVIGITTFKIGGEGLASPPEGLGFAIAASEIHSAFSRFLQ